MIEKFNQDIISAMKNKDKKQLTVLRMVKGAMQLESINKKLEIDDELLTEAIVKQIKLRNDSIIEFEKANRLDLVNQDKEEIKILNKYLPEQLTNEELNQIIDEAFNNVKPTSSKDMGLIMKEVTPKVKGVADMKLVSSIIKDKLNNI